MTKTNNAWLTRARLAINIPDLSAYEDTLKVIGDISTHIARCYVLTVEGQSLSTSQQARWPQLSLITIARRGFPKGAARWVTQRVNAGGLEIIHDLFGHFSRFCERAHQPHRSYIMIHTQRTTNWGWFERVRPLRYQIDKRYASQRARSLWYDTRIIHAVDHVTVMGPGHEQDLIQGHKLPQEKVSFIPSETDCDRFTPKSDHDQHTLRKSMIEEDCPSTPPPLILLYVGAFVRAKGLELLFNLFAELGADRPELKLVLIGRETPFERRWFQKRVSSHPLRSRLKVCAFMPREELIDHYRAAHLFIFPSLFEGSPRALREAIACGTPVIASDIPGHRGVDPQAQFIHFAPTHDLTAWQHLTQAAIDEPLKERQNRSYKGIKWLRENHHPSAVAQRWLALYHHVARQRQLT